jgi:hypothetical protein
MRPAALSGVLAVPQRANRTEKILLLAIYCTVGQADIQRRRLSLGTRDCGVVRPSLLSHPSGNSFSVRLVVLRWTPTVLLRSVAGWVVSPKHRADQRRFPEGQMA